MMLRPTIFDSMQLFRSGNSCQFTFFFIFVKVITFHGIVVAVLPVVTDCSLISTFLPPNQAFFALTLMTSLEME